ncbi:hypothetical protein [Amycolatopsis sp. H20-H5]|uniref:hypothetical protein n=1 Tax=Amycolatopsis sp. H20-H5 TaxID=3046309 RepID=UPI002DBE1581|nr:hypothetical protein [Amycolatopsis sp. H20-H5]MEC3982017.1 hypothetical protein [Amycolatopsis sp. H20-H5]
MPDPAVPGTGRAGSKSSAGKQNEPPQAAEAAPTTASPESATSAAPVPSPPEHKASLTDKDKLDAVTKFYKSIDLSPSRALGMLTPVLAGSEPGNLIRAWSAMDSIEVVETSLQPDGSILAVVTMRQPDGGKLRVTQLLRMAEDASGLISDARLLSAQYM